MAALAMSGCATKSDIRDVQTELRSLALRQDSLIAQLRRETLSTQDTIRTQSDQLFDFRGEITRQLREIGQGLATLQAIAGENQRGITSVRDQLANMRRGTTTTLPTPGPGDSTGIARGETVGGAGGGNSSQLWSAAMEQLSRGSLNTAQRAFQQFLTDYPNDELAPDARYYLADILVQQGKNEDGLAAFQEIPSLYPTASKVPDALLRIALLQIDMKNTDAARETLQRIINTYPGSAIALIARDKLEEIG